MAGDILVIKNFTDSTYFAWSKELERPILELPLNAVRLMSFCDDLIFYQTENSIVAIDKNGNSVWESQESYFPEDCAIDQQYYSASDPYGPFFIDNTSENVYSRADVLEGGNSKQKLVAVDRQSGKVNWVDDDNEISQWLGEVDGKVIYSHKEFGLTQALDAKNHQLVWENSGLVMDALVGAAGKTIVGLTNVNFGGTATIVGINAETGEQIWSQPGENASLIGDNLILASGSNVTFVDPQSGNSIQKITLSDKPYEYHPVGDYLVVIVASPGVMSVAVIKL